MGPRLGRVEYGATFLADLVGILASMGPRLGRVEYTMVSSSPGNMFVASMGPRLGRVEYRQEQPHQPANRLLQWGHA